MQASSVISLFPSFNNYNNTRLAEVAARVVEEFGSQEYYDEFYFDREENTGFVERVTGNCVIPEEDDDEFEFAFVKRDPELPSPVSADEIFCNGQIRPVYPVFNRGLFLERSEFVKENDVFPNSDSEKGPTARLQLRKLFIEERETTMTMARTTSSSSSSEADELKGVPTETYCVWRPKEAAAAAEAQCKKSSSIGSNSKRWKFKDLLHRSHSDGGKDRFVFLSPSISGRRKENEEKVKTPVGAGKVKSTDPPPYNREGREKRRSYLAYRQDLAGLFASVNGFSKNLQAF